MQESIGAAGQASNETGCSPLGLSLLNRSDNISVRSAWCLLYAVSRLPCLSVKPIHSTVVQPAGQHQHHIRTGALDAMQTKKRLDAMRMLRYSDAMQMLKTSC
jgi:hypothetical protein